MTLMKDRRNRKTKTLPRICADDRGSARAIGKKQMAISKIGSPGTRHGRYLDTNANCQVPIANCCFFLREGLHHESRLQLNIFCLQLRGLIAQVLEQEGAQVTFAEVGNDYNDPFAAV